MVESLCTGPIKEDSFIVLLMSLSYEIRCEMWFQPQPYSEDASASKAPKHWHTAHVENGVIICLLSRHIAKSDVGGNHLALMSHIIYLKFKYLNEFPFPPHTQFPFHLVPDFVSPPFSWKIFELFDHLCLAHNIQQRTDDLCEDFFWLPNSQCIWSYFKSPLK